MNVLKIKALEENKINELRIRKGLSTKASKLISYKNVEVADTPDQVGITGAKEERDFVYMNFNNGDSYAYYHPISNPDVIYNFKGEPNYRTKDINPVYYERAVKRAEEYKRDLDFKHKQVAITDNQELYAEAILNDEDIYLAFRDQDTDQYQIGFYNPKSKTHDFQTTSSRSKINDYLAQNGVKKPNLIETWKCQFAPDVDTLFDPDGRFINKFQPSSYMTNAEEVKNIQVPPTILKVIEHVCGNDNEVIQHFLNWFAYIFKYRIRTQTAWILQGTTGTGKGVLFSHILRPLIGDRYCQSITLSNLEDSFNKFWEECLILFIDEVDAYSYEHERSFLSIVNASSPDIGLSAFLH